MNKAKINYNELNDEELQKRIALRINAILDVLDEVTLTGFQYKYIKGCIDEISEISELRVENRDKITCKIVGDALVGVLNDKRNYRTK